MIAPDHNSRPLEGDSPFRLLTEESSDMLSRHTPDGVYRYASPAALSLLGYQPSELLGRPVFELFHPEELEAARQVHEEIHRTHGTVTMTHRLRGKSGAYVWFECSTRAVRDPATGEVLEIHAVSRDVTRRLEAERALRESEDRFRGLIEQMEVGVVVYGRRGEVQLANPASLELLGLSKEQFLGRTAFNPGWTAVQEDLSPIAVEMRPAVVALLTGRPVRNVVMGVERPRGRGLVWLLVNATPQFDDSGLVSQVIASFSDITDRRAAEQERGRLIAQLQDALASNNTLRGLLPICAGCKNIRDDQGYWRQIEDFIQAHSEAEFSHSLCPDCAKRLFGDYL